MGPGGQISPLAAVSVQITTTGADIDPDGYSLEFGGVSNSVAVNDTIVFADLAAGSHTATLDDMAPNCQVDVASLTYTVFAGDTVPMVFDVMCAGIPTELAVVRDGDIWLIDTEGGPDVNITNFPTPPNGYTREAVFGSIDWAPSGDRLVAVTRIGCFCGDQYFFSIFFVDGSPRIDLDENDGNGSWLDPRWSPDGSKIAFSMVGTLDTVTALGGSDVAVANADGSGLINLTESLDYAEINPSWSPSGAQIAYFAGSTALGNRGLFVMNANGGGANQVSDGFSDGHPDWSPNGSKIVFRREPPPSTIPYNYDIWIMNANGTDPMSLVDDGAVDDDPAWSPLGDRVVFTSRRDDVVSPADGVKETLYVVNPDGSGEAQLMPGHPGGAYPRWRPVP